jgi:hypothetical protein
MSFVGFDYFSAIIVAEIAKSPFMQGGQVFDYAATQFPNYPAVVVTADNLQSSFGDTKINVYNFNFSIFCFISRLNNEEQSEITMRALVDDIMQRLNNNQNINGTNNTFGKPITAVFGYGSFPEPDMRIATLKLNIEVGQDNTLGGGILYTANNKPLLT